MHQRSILVLAISAALSACNDAPSVEVVCTNDTVTAGSIWYYAEMEEFVWSRDPVPVGSVIYVYDVGPHMLVSDRGSWAASEGEERCVRYDEPGAYPWHCALHPDDLTERGVINVE